ncbi:MAG: four helix bundle protein [Pyrinomonadaceae bacterium]
MRTKFVELRVYQMSEILADKVWTIVLGWNNLATDTVGKQLIRSVDSIGANISEGEGRGSHADNKRFVRIARGSLQETQHWLRRAYKRNLLTAEEIEELKPLIDQLGPSLNAYLSRIGTSNVQKPKTKNEEQ